MPNQMPNAISDWDLANTVLIMQKHELVSLATYLAEAGQPQLAQDYMQSFQNVLNHQKQLYQYMNRKGFYKPIPAGQEQIQAAAQQVNLALSQIGGPGAPQPGIQAQMTGAQQGMQTTGMTGGTTGTPGMTGGYRPS